MVIGWSPYVRKVLRHMWLEVGWFEVSWENWEGFGVDDDGRGWERMRVRMVFFYGVGGIV